VSAVIPADFRVAFWLLPVGRSRMFFEGCIRTVAEDLSGPVFTPHITVHVQRGLSLKSAEKIIRETAERYGPFVVRTGAVALEDTYTKAMFLRVLPSKELTALSSYLRDRAGEGPYGFDPHVSLAYSDAPEETKRRVIEELGELPGEVTCGELQAISITGPVTGPEDVARWRPVSTVRLGV